MPWPSATKSLMYIFGGTVGFSTPVVQRTGHHATNVGMEVRFLPGVPDQVMWRRRMRTGFISRGGRIITFHHHHI